MPIDSRVIRKNGVDKIKIAGIARRSKGAGVALPHRATHHISAATGIAEYRSHPSRLPVGLGSRPMPVIRQDARRPWAAMIHAYHDHVGIVRAGDTLQVG